MTSSVSLKQPETVAMDSLDSCLGFAVLLCFGRLNKCHNLFEDTCEDSEVLVSEQLWTVSEHAWHHYVWMISPQHRLQFIFAVSACSQWLAACGYGKDELTTGAAW